MEYLHNIYLSCSNIPELDVPLGMSLIEGYPTRKLLNQELTSLKMKPSLRKFYSRHHNFVNRYGISVTNEHVYAPLLVSISWSFTHSWLIAGFVTRVTLRVSLVEQELLTLQEHLSSSPVLSGVRVARVFVFCGVFCRSPFVLLSCFFWP
jgi:hypothetical protein